MKAMFETILTNLILSMQLNFIIGLLYIASTRRYINWISENGCGFGILSNINGNK